MFSKKPRRNFRTRRDDSSEEDEQKTKEGEENSVKPPPALRRPKLPQSRGISCSSKSEEAAAETKKSHISAEDANDQNKAAEENKAVTDGKLFEGAENTGNQKSGGIPDAKLIREALRRRRAAKAQRDYIPLGCAREGSRSSEEEAERDGDDDDEDDDDGEDDDHERRIQFAPKFKTLRERVAEEIGSYLASLSLRVPGGSDSEEDGMNSQGDDVQAMWEEQQIRKGVAVYKHSSRDTVKQKRKIEIPESLPQISIGVIKKRVLEKLDTLREVSRRSVMDLQRVQLDMDSAKATLEKLESGSSHEQHRFYKGMRLYTQNLLECLGEKVVEINALELDMHTLLIDQAEALLSRRRESVREVSTRLQLLAYGADPSDNGHGDKAHLEAQEQSQSCETAEADYERLPADDEPLPEEAAELSRRRDEIVTKAENIFADVHEDFSDAKNILSKFNEWRVRFSESYENAYISLCIPKLLAPLVRQQLIGWDPLSMDCQDIEAFPWYSAVEDFCHRKGGDEVECTDSSVLKSVIEKSILPKIQGFVELIWDPLSSGQSQCLVNLCQNLQDDYKILSGEQSKQVKALLEAVAVRLRSAVDVDVFIPLYPKKFLDDPSSPQFQFRDKQFYSAVKLLHNVMLWHGLVPEDLLMELGLTKLLSRYLMITLWNAPLERHSVEKCKKVAACFPKTWFEDAGASIPELRVFSEHLHQTAHTLCKKNPITAVTRDVVTDLLNLLRNMKALDSVADIVETYHLGDILERVVVG